jgi:hypothetical protein
VGGTAGQPAAVAQAFVPVFLSREKRDGGLTGTQARMPVLQLASCYLNSFLTRAAVLEVRAHDKLRLCCATYVL